MAFLIGGANSEVAGYNIENSLRFDGDSYQSRDPSETGITIKGNFSAWVKFATSNTEVALFGGFDSSGANDNDGYMVFKRTADGNLQFEGGDNVYLETTALFRDTSAWYHIVLAIDSSNATANNKQRIYVNGAEITAFDTRNNLTNLQDLPMNSTAGNDDRFLVGCDEDTGGRGLFFTGYMADVYWIDNNSQMAASDFGEYNDNGVWIPKDGSDISFGDKNSFKMEYGSSGNLGLDSSGLGNSLGDNAGLAATNQTTDTPTNNFATLNPLMAGRSSTLSEGNLKVTGESDNTYDVATFGSSMKWYMEWKVDENFDGSGGGIRIGAIHEDDVQVAFGSLGNTTAKYYTNSNDGKTQFGGGNNETTGLTRATTNDIIMCACDGAGAKIWWGINGTWLDYGSGAGDPAAGNNAAPWTNAMKAGIWFPATVYSGTAASGTLNLGNPPIAISSSQADDNGYGNFEYDVPAGFYSLCTKNLAEHG
jgi:hypothetical protein|tara:strand:+ start:118 stop:1554 length:1437 start_codon:yes stop_codon:yes gene_type:complete